MKKIEYICGYEDCKYSWLTRIMPPKKPKECPNCKRREWDKKR